MSTTRDLETLLAIARQKEAEKSSSEAAQVAAIRTLANAGGALPVRDLISRYGISSQTIAALCDEEQHKDKRRKVRARLGEVEGEAICWLTASGHQASGKSRGVEIRPTSDSLKHALAPSKLAAWLEPLEPVLAERGASLFVTWGPSCYAFSRTCESLAWARLKTHADPSGALGLLTGSLIPDALIVERWAIDERGSQLFQKAWGVAPRSQNQLAENVCAVEVQNATRQAGDPLLSKVNAWEMALTLGVADCVLWIVEPAACKVLSALGVGDPQRRPGQLLIPSGAVGLGGQTFNVASPEWWVLALSKE